MNLANLLQYVIYENPCAPKVSKSQNSYALVGLRRGSLTDKKTTDVARALAGLLDKTKLPSEWLVWPKNPGWAEKSGLVIWKDNRYWPCKHWKKSVEKVNNLVLVKDCGRQYYGSRHLLKDPSFFYNPVTKTLEWKVKSTPQEQARWCFSMNQDTFLQE